MDYNDYVKLGLKNDGNLKVILKGSVEEASNKKVGVVSVVYVTNDVEKAKQKLAELNSKEKGAYYMVYSCPLDTFLPDLGHYPSIEIGKEDLQ